MPRLPKGRRGFLQLFIPRIETLRSCPGSPSQHIYHRGRIAREIEKFLQFQSWNDAIEVAQMGRISVSQFFNSPEPLIALEFRPSFKGLCQQVLSSASFNFRTNRVIFHKLHRPTDVQLSITGSVENAA